MGLQPAGVNGYYQPVKFDVTRVIADKSSVALVVDGRKEPLVLGKDAILGSRGTQPKSITAPLVFIGYGLHLPEAKYDDFDSPEVPFSSLKGKIVVMINGGPGELSGALKSFARTSPLAKALADAGAVGSISIPTPKSMDFPWDRVAANASQPGMRLAADPKDAAVAATSSGFGGSASHHVLGDIQSGGGGEIVCRDRSHVCGVTGPGRCAEASAAVRVEEEPDGCRYGGVQRRRIAEYRGETGRLGSRC